jgi:hypothetical protein
MQRKNHDLQSWWVLIMALLTACGQAMTSLPSNTQTKVYFPIPTETPEPTKAFTPTMSLTPTATFIPTQTVPAPTLYALMTITPFIHSCNNPSEWRLSPDGQWFAESCQRETRDGPGYIKVLNIYKKREWRVDFDMTRYGNDGCLYIVHWSNDGKFLYVAPSPMIDSIDLIYPDGIALLRLNLFTGQINEILSKNLYAFSFSAGNKLAYVSDPFRSPQKLNILDLHTWNVRQFILSGYCSVGGMLWDPTEEQIVFEASQCNDTSDPYHATSFMLVLVNLEDGSQKQLWASEKRLPGPLVWKADSPVYANWEIAEFYDKKCWSLNLGTRELLPAPCP